MRRLWLKYRLWKMGYCFKHMRPTRGRFQVGHYCPECDRLTYEDIFDQAQRDIQELERLNAAR